MFGEIGVGHFGCAQIGIGTVGAGGIFHAIERDGDCLVIFGVLLQGAGGVAVFLEDRP